MTTAEARRRRDIERLWLGRFTLALLIVAIVSQFWTDLRVSNNQNHIQEITDANRATLCGAARILSASPNPYVPQLETKEQYRQIVFARSDFLQLVRGIDCTVVLAGALHHAPSHPPVVPPKGGGLQSSPQTGSQLPGGHRAPRPLITDR